MPTLQARIDRAALALDALRTLRALPASTPSATEIMCAAGLDPDPWQIDLLESHAQRVLLNCSRQSGKSTVTAALALGTALAHRSLTLLLSPSLRQSQELFRKVCDFTMSLGDAIPTDQVSALRMTLRNGSRIVALPGKEQTIRGYSGVALLVIDEAARVADDLYYSVRPMLAVSGGRLICLSTPFGMRGFFHSEWSAGDDWARTLITATDCPRITPEFLESERRALGPIWYAQEYECSFVADGAAVFRHDDIMALSDDSLTPFF